MHTVAVQLLPVLAAEKSKVPFYIAGGVLVAWALSVSLFGLRRSDFPAGAAGQRLVMAVTALLVVVALAMAVITSGPAAGKAAAATPAPASSQTPPG
jgi:hypothetical protein